MNAAKRLAIYERLRAANPKPKSELEYRDPFELLVAVMLSAQATDRAVNRVTGSLFQLAGTPQAMLRLGDAGLMAQIKSIGLYRSKAKHILATCAILVKEHAGEVPRDRESLEDLPGVGRKTANVVLNVAFGEPTIAVDTHIFRVSNRTRLATGKTPREVERKLERYTPQPFKRHAHHWLILHGRYVCQARKPRCGECLIADLCEFPAKSVQP